MLYHAHKIIYTRSMKLSFKSYIFYLIFFGTLNLLILEIALINFNGRYILKEESLLNSKQQSLIKGNRLRQYFKYDARIDYGVRPHPLLPSGILEMDDRIEEQIRFSIQSQTAQGKPKIILDLTSQVPTNLLGDKIFVERDCPVKNCNVTRVKVEHGKIFGNTWKDADAVLIDRGIGSLKKLPHQVWIFSSLESPMNTGNLSMFEDKINWTYTYRRDSTIVSPYFKFMSYGNFSKTQKVQNYAYGKQKLIAWFVSNCNSKSGRLQYVDELQKYIPVDIYGACGNVTCQRGLSTCDTMLDKEYKFYLSFENSLCKDYITEKLLNALNRNIVPVVLGASNTDYFLAAPPNSFIHVDNFTSPKELAGYLWYLHKNDQEYNKYFQWKNTGYFMDTKTICRICSMLHADLPPVWYTDIATWWSKEKTCLVSNYSDASILREWLQRINKSHPGNVSSKSRSKKEV